MFGQNGGDFGFFFGRQFAGITALASGVDSRVHKGGAERCDLLRCVRAHVIAFDNRPKTVSGRYGLQAGDAESHDQNLGGPNRTGGGRDLGQHASEMRSPKFDGVVSRQCRLAR